jgi:hypothetical protein
MNLSLYVEAPNASREKEYPSVKRVSIAPGVHTMVSGFLSDFHYTGKVPTATSKATAHALCARSREA